MKKYMQYVTVATLLFISSSTFALAAQTTPVLDSSTTPQPFTVSCSTDSDAQPVLISEGGLYKFNGDVCNYTISQTESSLLLGLFKGTVGNSSIKSFGTVSGGPTSWVQTGEDFSGATDGDHYFFASVGGSDDDISNAFSYLQDSTSGTVPSDYNVVNFVWGTPVVIVPTRAPLTVTADNKNIELGSPLPAFTATLSGFVTPDNATTNDVTGAASCAATGATGTTLGVYPITCTVGTLISANKYNFQTFTNGTLTIVDTTKPTVSITTPLNGSLYHKTDAVIASASINDLSPISNVVYKLNGAVVNAANPLPISANPSSTSTLVLVVAATDAAGNTGYATSTFMVAPVPTSAPADTTPPTIVITSPVKYGIYGKTDTVFLTATITDQSPIATNNTTYWLNGVKINPATKLALSSAPLISKVSVAASDIYGNRATTTQTFFVVKSTSSCLTDIIAIVLALSQDKTLPDKPTLLNLIADCSCFSKGLHRFDLH